MLIQQHEHASMQRVQWELPIYEHAREEEMEEEQEEEE